MKDQFPDRFDPTSETNPAISSSRKQARISIVPPKSSEVSPTSEAYGALQFASDYFNGRLFGGRLPRCLITLTRKPRALGYFSPERFRNTDGAFAHEISLNPRYLEARGDYDALSTMVHELAHVARFEFGPRNAKGRPGTRGYHDRAWAEVMLRVGLIPSDTGKPGGKKTGTSVSHYVQPGGPFDVACSKLLIDGFTIDWRDSLGRGTGQPAGGADGADGADVASSQTRAKFTCPACRLNAWAKPAALFACLPCRTAMVIAA